MSKEKKSDTKDTTNFDMSPLTKKIFEEHSSLQALKFYWNRTPKSPRISNFKTLSDQAPKPWKTTVWRLWIQSTFTQITLQGLRVLLEARSKGLETSKDSKSVKFKRFEPLKLQRTFIKKFRRWITFKEYTNNTKNVKNEKSWTSK